MNFYTLHLQLFHDTHYLMTTEWVSTTEATKILNRTVQGVYFLQRKYKIPMKEYQKGRRTLRLFDRAALEELSILLPPRRESSLTLRPRLCKRSGYMLVYFPVHPRAMSGGFVYEHWLVMEKHLGRPLTKEECVHHKNRKRHDNRIKNLHLYANRSQHMKEAHNELREFLLKKLRPK